MADDTRKIIRVSADSDKVIREYAERRGIEFGDAADALIATAISRLNALKRYSKNKEPQAPGKPRAKKAAKAKAPKKAAKAKAPAKAKRAALNGASAHA